MLPKFQSSTSTASSSGRYSSVIFHSTAFAHLQSVHHPSHPPTRTIEIHIAKSARSLEAITRPQPSPTREEAQVPIAMFYQPKCCPPSVATNIYLKHKLIPNSKELPNLTHKPTMTIAQVLLISLFWLSIAFLSYMFLVVVLVACGATYLAFVGWYHRVEETVLEAIHCACDPYRLNCH